MPALERAKHPETVRRNALLCQGFLEGKTIEELAAQFNISFQMVSRWLDYYDIRKPRRYRHVTRRKAAVAIRMAKAGKTRRQIAKAIGVSQLSSVRRLLRRYGVPRLRGGRRPKES